MNPGAPNQEPISFNLPLKSKSKGQRATKALISVVHHGIAPHVSKWTNSTYSTSWQHDKGTDDSQLGPEISCFRPKFPLCGVWIFSLCLHGFTLFSSPQTKNMQKKKKKTMTNKTKV